MSFVAKLAPYEHFLTCSYKFLYPNQMFLLAFNCSNACIHGLRTPREEIVFNAWPKINSHSQIFRYDGSILCLRNRPNFSDIFELCLHWVSVVRACIRPEKPLVTKQLKKYSVLKIVLKFHCLNELFL